MVGQNYTNSDQVRKRFRAPVNCAKERRAIKIADVEMDHDSDPIKASYDVYIKPQISSDRQIYILQFPNRDSRQHYSAANESQPLKLRIKEKAGMLELDVPVDAWRNYDREKGIKWGEAIKRSNMAKGGGSHGMPGGFGIGGAQSSGRGRGRGDADEEINQQTLLEDYAGAIQREQVLTKQTLGGQSVANEDTTPQYMIGAFRKNQLHLTPVNHIVQMRPQFHHIDALSEQERLARPRDLVTMPARVSEARAIHMTVKSSVDGEEDSTDTMAERITAAQQEPWRNHRYIDEDSSEAWDAFHENLFVGAEGGMEEDEELQAKVPKLVSGLDDGAYLDTISAPRDAARLSRSKRVKKDPNRKTAKGKEKEATGDEESDSSSTLSDLPSNSETEKDGA